MSENSFTVSKDIKVMGEEPYPDINTDDIKFFLTDGISEETLAMSYAIASNKLWWLEDDMYDELFSEEAAGNARKWYELMLHLQNLIFGILKHESVIIPDSGYLTVLEPFMGRNGYNRNADGWWTRDAQPDIKIFSYVYESALSSKDAGTMYKCARILENLMDEAYEDEENVATPLIVDLYENAANSGSSDAMYKVGIIYEMGLLGVEPNAEESFFWYLKAANAGHDDSCFYAGLCYQEGLGSKPDYGQAMKYYRIGEKADNPYCIHQIGVLYGRGLGVPKDSQTAYKYYLRASQQGVPEAFYNIGVFFETGELGMVDIPKAIEFYEKAAELRDEESEGRLKVLR